MNSHLGACAPIVSYAESEFLRDTSIVIGQDEQGRTLVLALHSFVAAIGFILSFSAFASLSFSFSSSSSWLLFLGGTSLCI